MPQSHQLRFCKGDILAAGFVLAVACVLSVCLYLRFPHTDAITARIYLDGRLIHEMPLNQNGSYTASGLYHNTITVQNGRIAVTATDCPGADCQHTGWIQSAGRSIVCLPNRMELVIVGEAPVDAVVE